MSFLQLGHCYHRQELLSQTRYPYHLQGLDCNYQCCLVSSAREIAWPTPFNISISLSWCHCSYYFHCSREFMVGHCQTSSIHSCPSHYLRHWYFVLPHSPTFKGSICSRYKSPHFIAEAQFIPLRIGLFVDSSSVPLVNQQIYCCFFQ